MHRTRAPVSRSSIIALCVLSQILNLSGSCSIDGPANAKMWSNTIRACPNDDATQRTSPRRMASGPRSAAVPIPATSVDFPLPRAMLSAALPGLAKTARMYLICHGIRTSVSRHVAPR